MRGNLRTGLPIVVSVMEIRGTIGNGMRGTAGILVRTIEAGYGAKGLRIARQAVV